MCVTYVAVGSWCLSCDVNAAVPEIFALTYTSPGGVHTPESENSYFCGLFSRDVRVLTSL